MSYTTEKLMDKTFCRHQSNHCWHSHKTELLWATECLILLQIAPQQAQKHTKNHNTTNK